jgi:poly(3-hydroxybutyrate) depolymerase
MLLIWRVMRSFIAVLFGSSTLGMSWPGAADAAQVSKQTDSMGRDYYLFTPDKIDPGITYWLVVEVHGYGGQGSLGSGVREWADRNDCIGVAPSFPNEGYQLLGKDSDRQLIGIFQKLQNQYKLHDKLFIYGHSGGAQFSHRFALKYPQLVIGCCATSAGTWATGAGYGDLPEMAASLPFAISCGERDTGFAAPGMPMNRITWARRFEEYLGKRQGVWLEGHRTGRALRMR